MKDPDAPTKLPPPAYPPRTLWWKIKRLVGYPREITDWEHFTWDTAPPPNRPDAFKETRRELQKPPQNILQDAMEQLTSGHAIKMECIQKSTISLLAVSAYETQRATWWLQALTWSLLTLTTILVLQTWKLISLETGKHVEEPPVEMRAKARKNNQEVKDAVDEDKTLPDGAPPVQE